MNDIERLLDFALKEEGYLEKSRAAYKTNKNIIYEKTAGAGSDNYTKYGKEMYDIYPAVMDFPAAWCDCFVDWCFYKIFGITNAKALLGGNFDDYTVNSANLYKNKNAYIKRGKGKPKAGDQIFFRNTSRICHTGLVYKVDDKYVYTIEGNTSGASGVIANGGGVKKKKYPLTYSSIDGYGRPNYSVEGKPSKVAVSQMKAIESAKFIDKKYSGTYITTANLNLRNGAGTDKTNLITMPKGTEVKNYGYFTITPDNKIWLLVETRINKMIYTGFCSINYLTK